jgi:murein DD-endopeptidase MepM/ murein hydrolase activator NlpD
LEVETHGIVYWLHLIGYHADLEQDEMHTELFGWNQNSDYRWKLINRAKEINEAGGFDDITIGDINVYVNNEDGVSFIKSIIALILVKAEILPENLNVAITPGSQVWLSFPVNHENLRSISQYWKGLTHQGIDFACVLGTPVIAVADGVRVEPSNPAYTWDLSGWGNAIWLDHGGLYTLYAHNSSITVKFGESVKKGQEIGKCGSTGNSTGPHVHFGVSLKHPDDLLAWYDTDAWRDPSIYLGKKVNVNKE